MTEKVFGISEEKAKKYLSVEWLLMAKENGLLVPVVSLEWLKKFCAKHEVKTGYGMMPFIHSHDLLKAVEKQASQKAR